MIQDISIQSYNKRTFPVLYAQEDFCKGALLYEKNREFPPYCYNYDTVIALIKQNKLNTQKVLFMKNAPLI